MNKFVETDNDYDEKEWQTEIGVKIPNPSNSEPVPCEAQDRQYWKDAAGLKYQPCKWHELTIRQHIKLWNTRWKEIYKPSIKIKLHSYISRW